MSARIACSGLLLGGASLIAACTGGGASSQTAAPDFASRFTSSHFLQFLNRQPSLAAGSYRLVAATQQPNQAGSFTLSVTLDEGTVQTFTGTWTASGGADPAAAGNPGFPLVLKLAGGLRGSLSASLPAQLYLLDRAGNVIAGGGAAAGAETVSLNLPSSQTDTAAYAAAYYQAIDPGNTRDTFDKWFQANGFGAGDTAHAIFRDTVDLGYGRDMHLERRADGGIAVYVRNFQVSNVAGQQYSSLNLDAAIDQDPQYLLGMNAIEWGPIHDAAGQPVDLNGDGIVDQSDFMAQFFTFVPRAPYGRQLSADMDGQGNKAMPVPCIVCHGGRADLLLPDGSFPRRGDVSAHLQPLDLGIFEFSSRAGFTQPEEEAALKLLNQAAYDSYAPNLGPPPAGTPKPARWDSTQARALLESFYGGSGLPATQFQAGTPPAGWTPDPASPTAPPAGADHLYNDIEGAYCRSCHLLRGTDAQSDIDFSTYDKFIGYAADIQSQVYDKGNMPLALLQTDLFYASPATAQELASYLPGFSDFGSQGTVNIPGRPVAVAPPPYTGPSPVALSAGASVFATQYQWSILSSPPGSTASFDDPGSVRPSFSASQDGQYVLQLIVAGTGGQSQPVTASVTIDSTLPKAPADLTFDADIKPVLQQNCAGCHSATTHFPFIPRVWYTDPAPGENRNLYQDVRARVNLVDPQQSLLLTRPAGQHHGGRTRSGFDPTAAQHAGYDLFLAWIAAGAREK
ncbi:MAG: hypothetical protein ISP90_08875 [Nevskia sp.]|nr:hypothetical protein [Nevskia sp.]